LRDYYLFHKKSMLGGGRKKREGSGFPSLPIGKENKSKHQMPFDCNWGGRKKGETRTPTCWGRERERGKKKNIKRTINAISRKKKERKKKSSGFSLNVGRKMN